MVTAQDNLVKVNVFTVQFEHRKLGQQALASSKFTVTVYLDRLDLDRPVLNSHHL